MASFHAKIGWKRQRNGENKNCSSVFSHPTKNRKFQKNSKKITKYNYGFISCQNRLEKAEKGRK